MACTLAAPAGAAQWRGSGIAPGVVPGVAPALPLRSSISSGSDGSFWDRQAGLAFVTAATASGAAVVRPEGAGKMAEDEDEKKGGKGGRAKGNLIQRVDSNQYWGAEQWDPDERVYVGAGAGQTNHLIAVDLTSQEMDNLIWRVWAGGLASTSLGLGGKAGPPTNLSGLADSCPKLQDLYEVAQTLGVGSFGAVRSGIHRASGTKCAVKTLDKLASGERYRKNLVDNLLGERLLRLTREAPHDNVARYLDMMEGPRHWYVVMEELSGPELLQQLEDQFPVTTAHLQRIFLQVLRSLAHIHGPSCGMVHRDVKLSNYRFRSPDPNAPLVLLDFGFACSIHHEWDRAHCGTLMFMAPEVIGSSARVPHLPAMDLWAAGVILYALLTGDSPVQEDEIKLFTKPETAAQAEEVVAKALDRSELKLASTEAYDLLKRLLVIEPAKRPSAQEALRHCWFNMQESERQLPVLSKAVHKLRSLSSSTNSRNFRLASGSNRSIDSPELPDLDIGLERIVSGEELVEPAPQGYH